jgi:uncharacterized protein (DUF362 family)
MSRAKVAVLLTRAESILDDYGRLMRLVNYASYLPKDKTTQLKINISWHVYFPSCSTAPWQLEGVVKTLLDDGYSREKLVLCQNATVVVDPRVGARLNKLEGVAEKYRLPFHYLQDEGEEWVRYQPKAKMLVLDKVYEKEGIWVPASFADTNIIHLPTVKTHVFTTMTGAMKNAFGGLLNLKRHWTHAVIHETLVDLLAIQKEIHSGLFAVMDGTVAGDGPGPRAMRPVEANVILASADQVAIDAISARLMGLDPLALDFIRLAHENGLGVGDPREIEVVGDDVAGMNLHFNPHEDTFASRGQKMIYHGWLKPLEHFLLRTPLVPWSFLASKFYHDGLWYPLVGKKRVQKILDESQWGKLFLKYPPEGIRWK